MKALNGFPAGAARNADFITGRSKPGRVIDCQRDLEDMPPQGSLCLHEDSVRAMVAKLGWELAVPGELAKAEARIEELETELAEIRKIMSDIAGYVTA